MYLLTRHLPRLLPALLLPVLLVACGGSSPSPSSGVLSGHSAVDVGGTVWTFGANGYGQLGNNSTNDSHTPVNVGGFDEVAIGGGHTVARRGGAVYTWGYNSNGQLGNGNNSNSSTPVQVGISNVTAIAAGARFTLALVSDGTNQTVYAWGNNNRGQLGDGTNTDRSTPVQVTGLPTKIQGIAAGGEFALALDGNGNVWAWGSNDNGQLGNVSAVNGVPVKVQLQAGGDLTGISKIAAGSSHSLATDGSNLFSWGYNSFGQLGNGAAGININPNTPSSANQPTAVKVSIAGSPTPIASISAGLSHSMALINGSVYAWGYNFFGQIGNGAKLYTNDLITTPQVVAPISNTTFSSVIATGNHSIAVDTAGHIWTWGMNTYGQLGDNTTTDRSTPSIVPGH